MEKPMARRNLAKDVETKQPSNKSALQFLDSIIALAPVNRQTHFQGQQALAQISRALIELETLKKEKTDGKET